MGMLLIIQMTQSAAQLARRWLWVALKPVTFKTHSLWGVVKKKMVCLITFEGSGGFYVWYSQACCGEFDLLQDNHWRTVKLLRPGNLSLGVCVVRSASWVQNLDNLGPVELLHLMKGVTGTGRCGLMHRPAEASASGSHLRRGMGLVGVFSE